MQAISRTSKNPEIAMKFLEMFNTDKYLNNLINFGIEGTHYVKVADNVIKAGPQNDQYNPRPDGCSATSSSTTSGPTKIRRSGTSSLPTTRPPFP